MRGILVHIIVAVLLAAEFDYEAMGEGGLFTECQLDSRELLPRL
jgi:hypothetical protein